MGGLAVLGRAWAFASILCGIAIGGWIILHEASFDDLNGLTGAALYFVWFALIGSFGALLASFPWMLVAGWPVAIVVRDIGVERWLRISFPIAASLIVGMALYYFDPALWIWPGVFAAPIYGTAVAYFNERFDHA